MRVLMSWCAVSGVFAAAAVAQPVPITIKLQPDVTRLDFEGSKKHGAMYMPSSTKLSTQRPDIVKKEPTYSGTPMYATVRLGNAARSEFAIALDESDPSKPAIYADLNGNGDLTDDDSSWKNVKKTESGSQYDTTLIFQTAWKLADGTLAKGPYALNFYRAPERDTINYYRASARTGTLSVNGETLPVVLLENDNDGLFNKPFDPDAPRATDGSLMTKPVWLTIGSERFDTRVTFGFQGINYLATVTDDGSSVTLTPTFKTISFPKPSDPVPMLGTGGQVPDFVAKFSDGTDFSPSTYRGKKALVIDMWATWCGPCLASLPHFSDIAAQLKGQDVEFIALNVFDDEKPYLKYVDGHKDVNYRFARDQAGRESEASIAKRLFKVSGIPATYVIAKDGTIKAAISGFDKSDPQLERALKELGFPIVVPETTEKPKKMIPATGLK